jgi:hypothetical protein
MAATIKGTPPLAGFFLPELKTLPLAGNLLFVGVFKDFELFIDQPSTVLQPYS